MLVELRTQMGVYDDEQALMVMGIAELRAKVGGSSAPSKTRKWALMGTLLAGVLTAGGAIGAAAVNSWLGAMSKDKQAEMIRQSVQAAVRSTEQAYWAGRTEGARDASKELREEQQRNPLPLGSSKVQEVIRGRSN